MISAIGSAGMQTSYVQRAARAPSQEEMFARIDSNGDGKIDKSELEAMLQQGPPVGATRSAPPPPPPTSTNATQSPDATQLIEQFDTDGDGTLNAEEATKMGDYLRAQMEAMIASMLQESQTSGLLWQELDNQTSSSKYSTAALQTYATQASSTLSESLFNALG
jgi:hypothetical protein